MNNWLAALGVFLIVWPVWSLVVIHEMSETMTKGPVGKVIIVTGVVSAMIITGITLLCGVL